MIYAELAGLLRSAIRQRPGRKAHQQGEEEEEEPKEEEEAEEAEVEGTAGALLSRLLRGRNGEALAKVSRQLEQAFDMFAVETSGPAEVDAEQPPIEGLASRMGEAAPDRPLPSGRGRPTLHIFCRASAHDGPGGLGSTLGGWPGGCSFP
jgi:hypothetical protein